MPPVREVLVRRRGQQGEVLVGPRRRADGVGHQRVGHHEGLDAQPVAVLGDLVQPARVLLGETVGVPRDHHDLVGFREYPCDQVVRRQVRVGVPKALLFELGHPVADPAERGGDVVRLDVHRAVDHRLVAVEHRQQRPGALTTTRRVDPGQPEPSRQGP